MAAAGTSTTPAPFYAGSAAPTPEEAALVTLKVSEGLGAEYVPMFQDALRMLCIQGTLQLMTYLSTSSSSSSRKGVAFFTADFILLLVYVLLGVMLYWMLVRRIFAVV